MVKYFKVTITAGSEKELLQRIKDLEVRGFELVVKGKVFVEGKRFEPADYKGYRKFISNECAEIYKAIMRRPDSQMHSKKWNYY